MTVNKSVSCDIQLRHRVGQVLNLYWEKTTEDILYRAIEDTEKSLQWSITDYTATEDLHLSDLLPGQWIVYQFVCAYAYTNINF